MEKLDYRQIGKKVIKINEAMFLNMSGLILIQRCKNNFSIKRFQQIPIEIQYDVLDAWNIMILDNNFMFEIILNIFQIFKSQIL